VPSRKKDPKNHKIKKKGDKIHYGFVSSSNQSKAKPAAPATVIIAERQTCALCPAPPPAAPKGFELPPLLPPSPDNGPVLDGVGAVKPPPPPEPAVVGIADEKLKDDMDEKLPPDPPPTLVLLPVDPPPLEPPPEEPPDEPPPEPTGEQVSALALQV